jgi:PAS domain S-box-containing protein
MKRVFLSLSGLLILSVCLLFGLPVSAEDNPTVRVGMYENSPKIFTDAHGNPSGFWVDIIEYIAGEEGWNVEYVPGTWDEGLTRLLNNQIDIMPDIAYSEERARLYDFTSEAVYVSWSSVYTRDDSEIQSILDLDGKTVVVLADSINAVGPEGIINLTRQFDVDCTFLDAHSYLDVFEMVASGEADAGVASKDFAGLHAEDFQLIHTPIIFQPASLRFALTRYAELSPSLQDRLDFHVNALKHDSGSILYSSIERWFGVKSEETFAFPEWLTWVLTSIGILFVLCLFGLYLMRVQVRRKTRDLRLEIEERKKIEETLNERERTFQTIAETTQDIICLHAPDYRFLYISPSCKKILGFDAAELIGSTPFELMHPEDTERLQTFFTEDGGKGESLFFECRVRNAAGDYRWFESVSNRIIDDDGTVTGYLTSSRDVTERKQREMEYSTLPSHRLKKSV